VSVYEPSPMKLRRWSRAELAALDKLLLRRFEGRVARGLALKLSCRHRARGRAKSPFGPTLTVYSQDSETPSRTGHNAKCKLQFVDVEKRRDHEF
jgi:hypothetical protein